MGLKSLLFRNSGIARRLESSRQELKAKLNEARAEIKSLKDALREARKMVGQPPPRSPEAEAQLATAVRELMAQPVPQHVPGLHQILPRVNLAVSDFDIMIKKSTPQHYLETGVSALSAINEGAPDLAGHPPRRILDFGSGFGRVARFLQAAWPQADLQICDVDFAGLAFCFSNLGMRGFQVGIDPAVMNLGTGYDLIWVGSVVTHLDAPVIDKLLKALAAALAPGGCLCFSAHGDYPVQRMKDGMRTYDLTPEAMGAVVKGYETGGFGYADYEGQHGYGVSATSPAWIKQRVEATPGLKWAAHLARGWAGHQDVVVCRADG